MDISFEGHQDIGMSEYLSMISRKTGALIRCAVNLGAVIGTQDVTTIEAFKSFGKSIGYAFQIRDDYLGVWGEEESTGKPVGADVKRKKNSFPVVHAMAQAQGKDRNLLVSTYQKDELTDDDVEVVLEIMEHTRTRDTAQELTVEHCELALQAIEGIELNPGTRDEIENLVEFLLVRQH
jgi:geranylgeranyl diphosphate synthase type I